MHIFYLQQVQFEGSPYYKVVAISTPRLPNDPRLGEILDSETIHTIVHNGFQVVIQPREWRAESDYFAGRKREIHIAPGYRVKRDTIPHQILTQPEPVQKTDKQPDKVETLRRPWYHFGIW